MMALSNSALCQVRYALGMETGYLVFQNTLLDVDPGPAWQGHHLENRDGFEFSLINGLVWKEFFYAGFGLGYQNFFDSTSRSYHGYSGFLNFEFANYRSKISPLFNMKLGTGRLWNQYEKGTRNFYGEILVGPMIRLTGNTRISLKSGMMIQQNASLIPIKVGLIF